MKVHLKIDFETSNDEFDEDWLADIVNLTREASSWADVVIDLGNEETGETYQHTSEDE